MRKIRLTLLIFFIVISTKAEALMIRVPLDKPTIQNAIDSATDGDTVIVNPGIYKENLNFYGKNIVVGSKYLTTDDPNYIENTVIDGNENGSVVTFENGEKITTILTGFTLKNGGRKQISDNTLEAKSYIRGGGIYCQYSSPSLTNLRIIDNEAYLGGGICCDRASPVLDNVIIHRNIAEQGGGGVYCRYSSAQFNEVTISENTENGICLSDYVSPRVTFTNVIIANNDNVGIKVDSGCKVIFNNAIIDNNDGGVAGAIEVDSKCEVIIENATIKNNDGGHAGGIKADDASKIILRNVLIYNNSAGYTYSPRPGGIWGYRGAEISLENVTIANNTPESTGVEIWLSDGSSIDILNSIVWGRVGNGIYIDRGYISSVNIAYSNIRDCKESITICNEDGIVKWNQGNISSDPIFVDPGKGDYHLQIGSPCIDAGDPQSDYFNEPSPNGKRINLGRYGNTNEAAISTLTSLSVEDIASTTEISEEVTICEEMIIIPNKIKNAPYLIKSLPKSAQCTFVRDLGICLKMCGMTCEEPDKVNFNLVGQWNPDYRSFQAIKMLQSWDVQGGIKPEHSYAYCATYEGLIILDIYCDKNENDQSFEMSVKSFVPIGNCRNLEIDINGKEDGNIFLYLITYSGRLHIIRINPENPELLNFIAELDISYSINGVTFGGEYIYVLDRYGDLIIIDIHNKTMPKIIAKCGIPGDAWDIAISGDYAYVTHSEENEEATGWDEETGSLVWYIGVNQWKNPTLQIIDISNKNEPMIIGECKISNRAQDITIRGDYIYIIDNDTGFHVMDISKKDAPIVVGNCDIEEYSQSITIEGNYAYVRCHQNRVNIIDITMKDRPLLVQTCSVGLPDDIINDIIIVGNYSYVASNNGVGMVDLKYVNGPKVIGSCDTISSSNRLALQGNLAYVTNKYEGLQIIDITNKSEPLVVKDYNVSGQVHDIAIMSSYAYIIGSEGLNIIHIPRILEPSFLLTTSTISDFVQANKTTTTSALSTNLLPALNQSSLSISPSILFGSTFFETEFVLGQGQTSLFEGLTSSGTTSSIDSFFSSQIESSPYLVGRLNRYGFRISVKGDYAYIAAGDRGCDIIDISIKSMPQLVGNCETPGWTGGIAVSGEYAYVTDSRDGLQVINISDKNKPYIIGSYPISYAEAIAISGHYAYIESGYRSIEIIDISNKSSPEHIGSFDIPSEELAIAGNYAYVVGQDRLTTIDVSNKEYPKILGTQPIYSNAYDGSDIAIDGDYAYVIGDCEDRHNFFTQEGIRYKKDFKIIDITNKKGPVILKNNKIFAEVGEVAKVIVSGDYGYIVSSNVLRIIDLKNKNQYIEIGNCITTGSILGITIRDNYAFVATGYMGLQIIDITEKERPIIVGSCNIPGYAKEVVLAGDYAFVDDDYSDKGLQIIDISDKLKPKIIKNAGYEEYFSGSLGEVEVKGDYAYMINGRRLLILNISKKCENMIVGSLDTPGGGSDVAVVDNYVYIAGSEEGLQIVDISTKGNPVIIENYKINTSMGIDIIGDYAYVTHDGSGLKVLDISNKTMPILIGCYDASYKLEEINIIKNYAYITEETKYSPPEYILEIVDLSTPQWPVMVGSLEDIPRSGVTIVENYAYITDRSEGLLKYKIDIGSSAKGNLIILTGLDSHHETPYQYVIQKLANRVFNTFITHGYETYDIFYFNPIYLQDIENDGQYNQLIVDDCTPTKREVETTIEQWSVGQTANRGPLYIYLIGHGAEDCFQIMHNEIITADELREYIQSFQRQTNFERDVVVILESAASGTFIDNLIGEGITVITSTNDGPSHIRPEFMLTSQYQEPTHYQSFTSVFMEEISQFFDSDYKSSDASNIPIPNLKEAFIAARGKMLEWAREDGLPFSNQAPQMSLPNTQITSLSFSGDGISPIDHRIIDDQQESSCYLTIIKQDPNGRYQSYTSNDLLFFSSDPSILNPDDPEDIEMENDSNGIPRYQISPRRNGVVTLIAYADESVNPDLLLSAKVTLEVSRDDLEYTIEKMAIIVAGYKGSGDYLWESTNTIGNHAYQTLRAMGYTDGEIYYYNPYLLQNLDNNEEDYEIHGYPHLKDIFDLSMNDSPFTLFKQSEATELLLFFVDHGGQYEFYLNPKETLEADYLLERINEMIDPEKKERIVLLSDTCYSGSFVTTINEAITNDRYSHITADKLVAIASTKHDQKAYYINKGIVSFSYPFFDEWFLTHSLMEAYEYAKYSIPFDDQDACLSDPDRIKVWDREDVYYIDDSRPVIDNVEYSRADGILDTTADVHSLSGISRVWAIVDKTYNAPINTFGEAVTDASEFSFQFVEDSDNYAQDPNKNCGTYTLAIPDPCPHEANYTLFIYAMDKSKREKTSHYRVFIGNEAENNTIAFIIESGSTHFPGETMDIYEKRRSQVDRAVNILKSKGLSIDNEKIINDRNGLSNISLQEKDKTLFIYLIGHVRIEDNVPYFYLTDGKLSNDEFFAYIPDDFDGRILILVDTPYASEFLDHHTSYWHENRIGIASTDQSKLFFHPTGSETKIFPCFSSFFFSGLLSGATVAQAYRVAENAASLTRQRPSLLPACPDYRTVNRRLGYYLGVSGIAGEEYSLFIDCNVTVEITPTGQRHYKLSLTPQQDANITSWVVLTSSPSAMDHHSMIVDLEKDNDSDPTYYGDVRCDILFYNASFIIEGRTQGESAVNKKWYQYQKVSIAHESGDITDDSREPDDDPASILSNNNNKLNENSIPIRRTFYCADPHECNDIDWVYFEAEDNTVYEIYAQDLSEYGYFVKLSLYDSTFNPLYDPPDSGQHITANNYLTFRCQESGLYLLEARLASSYPPCGVEYIVSVCNPQAGDITSVQGQVVNTQGEGINGLTIWIQDGGEFRKTYTVSLNNDDSETDPNGYFYKSGFTYTGNESSIKIKVGTSRSSDPYSNILKEFNVHSLPYSIQEGRLKIENNIELDYDSENIMICQLRLSKGINLFYFPSVSEETNISTSETIYYYNGHNSSWNRSYIIKSNHFNAIYTTEAKYIPLYRASDNQQVDSSKPILWLKGFIDSSCEDPEKSNHIDCLPDDLFDPDNFEPNDSNAAQRILDDQQIQIILERNALDYSWESCYRLFEESEDKDQLWGEDLVFRPYNVYIVIKNN